MYLDREIIRTVADLYWKPNIPCARAGHKVREPECSRLVLAATQTELQVCLSCPQGHKLAATSPWPARNLRPLPVAQVRPRATRESKPIPAVPVRMKSAPSTPETKHVVRKPTQALLPIAIHTPPMESGLAPHLAKLARALLQLTTDGRMRVSMLDLMRALGAATYDEADALVQMAGLRTSVMHGPIRSVLMDHSARQLLERAAASEVRQ